MKINKRLAAERWVELRFRLVGSSGVWWEWKRKFHWIKRGNRNKKKNWKIKQQTQKKKVRNPLQFILFGWKCENNHKKKVYYGEHEFLFPIFFLFWLHENSLSSSHSRIIYEQIFFNHKFLLKQQHNFELDDKKKS